MDDFISISTTMVPRLDTNQGDYLIEIKDQFSLFGAMQLISRNFKEIEDATNDFID